MKKLSRESHFCFHAGKRAVERRLAHRPQSGRIAERVLARHSSGQTAAASSDPMPGERVGCTFNSLANIHIAEKKKTQKYLRKCSHETSSGSPHTSSCSPVLVRMDPHQSHSSHCSNPTSVSGLPY